MDERTALGGMEVDTQSAWAASGATPDPEVRALIRSARPIGPSERLLDLGAGATARVLRERLGAAASITALEPGPTSALPFPDGSFELVLCQRLRELEPELGPVLAEVRRLLTPGGRFVASIGENGETTRAALLQIGFTNVSVERDGAATIVSARRP
jgi:SAM-dependent methyltransferase